MKRTDAPIFTEEQIQLLRDHLLQGAPEFELQRFLITCDRTGLDPFSRQIYGNVQNKNVGTREKPNYVKTVVIITSIDGFRAIGERSGEYRGQTRPEWYYVDDAGVSGWHDVFITARDGRGNPIKLPEACRVGIIREGFPSPCYGVANFDSFAVYTRSENKEYSLSTFWKKMPEHMIAKVAEAQGFRKAFPLLACGLYVEEEINGREDEEIVVPAQRSEDLPPGASWVEGHSPEERAKTAPNGPKTASDPQSATGTPQEPENAPQAHPERKAAPSSRKPKAQKGGDAPETANQPANPGTSGSAPAAAKVQPSAAASWENYVITEEALKHPNFTGRTVGSLSLEELQKLDTNWSKKFADSIKSNPVKSALNAEIQAALAFKSYHP